MPDEVLACGHVYVLNETLVHRMPSCMKCAACCTCVPMRTRFKEAEDAFDRAFKALGEIKELCQKIDDQAQKEQEKRMTKADWQRKERNG